MTPRPSRPGLLARIRAARAGVIVQGITGSVARRHARRMRDYGTPLVAGVVPGRGGQVVDGIPVYDTVSQARLEAQAGVCVAFLPPDAAADGLLEAAGAGIDLSVCLTEGVQVHDSAKALEVASAAGMAVIGPNTAGVALPGQLLLGFLPVSYAMPGSVAVVSRSGTLSYEVVSAMSQSGLGQSVWICVGGDRVKGVSFRDVIGDLAHDPEVEAMVLIGEIGGLDEEEAAELLAQSSLPTVALVAGRYAPRGVSMGHAGAFVDSTNSGWQEKAEALAAAGVVIAASPEDAVRKLRSVM